MKTLISILGVLFAIALIGLLIGKTGYNAPNSRQPLSIQTPETSGVVHTNRPSTKSESVSKKPEQQQQEQEHVVREEKFSDIGLTTNTAISSIDISKVLGGGPVKDGIPALFNPDFISIEEAAEYQSEDEHGLVIALGSEAKFYPYNILVWHEIVNDIVDRQPVIATFCPLCGSAIVFNPKINGEVEQFGVSGKLFESNLLMYDKSTETLWSQITGEAVVGDRAGQELEYLPSQIITFGEFWDTYPKGKVLSRETGYNRNYTLYPYGDYDTNESLYFPVSIEDARLPAKELMYIVNIDDTSVAFSRNDVLTEKFAQVDVNGTKITARAKDSQITVSDQQGNSIPGYHAMWFSWVTHHQENGIVWKK